MSEKRFRAEVDAKGHLKIITDGETVLNDSYKVVDLLNEQQATIQRMKHSLNTIYKAFEKHYGYDMRNAVWLIDELSYDEIVDELYIAETDSKNRKEASMYWKKKVDEQQATINELKAQLREKEEDEKLYANEILELRETNKEHIKFKSLGGDY